MKLALAVLVTAVVCFGIAAATGLARGTAKSYTLQVHDRAVFPGLKFQCQSLTNAEVACGALTIPNSVQVYYSAKQIAVVQFGKTAGKGTLLYEVKR